MELGKKGIPTKIPAMPKPYFPDYDDWRNATNDVVFEADTLCVGHSAGAEFLLRLLSTEKHIELEKLVLVAPYADEAGKYGGFSKYILDTQIGRRVGKLTILSSLDDSSAIQQNAHRLEQAIPEAELIELDGFGHFMLGNTMKSTDFPELIDILVQ